MADGSQGAATSTPRSPVAPQSRPAGHPLFEAANWFFRNRSNGRITLWQKPNAPLWIFFGATAVRLVMRRGARPSAAVTVVGTVALMVWAAAEVATGVSPYRRALGTVVILAEVASVVPHLAHLPAR